MPKKWDGLTKLRFKQGNYGKAKVFGFLTLNKHPGKYITAKELIIQSGLSYYSIGRLLPKWVSYGYVTRMPLSIKGIGSGNFAYRLEPKGRRWLRLASRQLPNYPIFLSQYLSYQKLLTPELIQKFQYMKFNDFVSTLDKLINEVKDDRQ